MQNIPSGRSDPEGPGQKKVANNTWLIRIGEYCIGLKLHNTFVVNYYPRFCTLHTGGWKTHTTKDRLNDFSPANIYQLDGEWYLSHITEEERWHEEFVEGMRVRYSPSRFETLKEMMA